MALKAKKSGQSPDKARTKSGQNGIPKGNLQYHNNPTIPNLQSHNIPKQMNDNQRVKISKLPTIKLVFDRKKQSNNTKSAGIEVQIYCDGKQWFYNTGIKISTYQWNNGLIINHPNAPELNNSLRLIQNKISMIAADLWQRNELSIAAIKEQLQQPEQKRDKIDAIEWFYETLEKQQLAAGTRKHHATAIKAVEDCGLFKRWADFTTNNINEWDYWLRQHTKVTKQSSLANYHKVLKAYLNRAVFADIIKQNPYDHFKINRGVEQKPKYLTTEEKKRIEKAEVAPTLEKIRDIFVFMMYTGLAYSDVAKLTKEDIVEEQGKLYIVNKRRKTGVEYKLQMFPNVIAIMEKYDYKLPIISLEKMNVGLKALASVVGLKKNLTTHMARHTFATWALSQGVPIAVVSKMLAHTDIKTTQIYAKVLQEDVNKGFDMLASKI